MPEVNSAALHLRALRETQAELTSTKETNDTLRAALRGRDDIIRELKLDLECAEAENRALRGQR